FLAYIDRAKLSEEAFPFSVGDEVVSFGDVSPVEAVAAVMREGGNNVEATDCMMAELRLTTRSASRGYTVPKGPITVAIKPQGSEKVQSLQLIWDYTAEKIRDPFLSLGLDDIDPKPAPKSRLFKPVMAADLGLSMAAENPYGLGTRKSFIPALGTKIWE